MLKAIGLIETEGLAISIEVTNKMLQTADVNYVYQEVEDIELVTILIEGDAESVKIAVEAGNMIAKTFNLLYASSIILMPDQDVKELVETGVKEGITSLRKRLIKFE